MARKKPTRRQNPRAWHMGMPRATGKPPENTHKVRCNGCRYMFTVQGRGPRGTDTIDLPKDGSSPL